MSCPGLWRGLQSGNANGIRQQRLQRPKESLPSPARRPGKGWPCKWETSDPTWPCSTSGRAPEEKPSPAGPRRAPAWRGCSPACPPHRRPVVTAHVSSLGRTPGTELSVISHHQGGQEEEGQQFQMLKEENGQPRILYPLKRAFRNTGEVKTFSDEEKRIEFVTSRPALPAQLTKGFQTKRK